MQPNRGHGMNGRFTQVCLLINFVFEAELSYAGRDGQFASSTSLELFGYLYYKICELYLALSPSLIQSITITSSNICFHGRVTHSLHFSS
jgi:hypothetical protein